MVVSKSSCTADLIVKYVGKTNKTHAQIAKAVGVTEGCMTHWTRGTNLPSQNNGLAICRELGIPYDEYMIAYRNDKAAGVGTQLARTTARAAALNKQPATHRRVEDALLDIMDIAVPIAMLPADKRELLTVLVGSFEHIDSEQCKTITAMIASLSQSSKENK